MHKAIAHYTTKTYPHARRLAERYQRAYPQLGQFAPTLHPNQAGWSVALTVGRDIVAYVPHPSKEYKLPGEPGYREAWTWHAEFKGNLPELKGQREAPLTLPAGTPQHRLIKEAKRVLSLTHARGTTNSVPGGFEHVMQIGVLVIRPAEVSTV